MKAKATLFAAVIPTLSAITRDDPKSAYLRPLETCFCDETAVSRSPIPIADHHGASA